MVVATCSAEYFKENHIDCDLSFEDKNSPYPLCTFVLNLKHKIEQSEIDALLYEKDDNIAIANVYDANEVISTLNNFMPYQKVSCGFIKALAKVLNLSYQDLIQSTHPIIPMKLKDGRIRIYALNDDLLHYGTAIIKVDKDIKQVKNVSKFPLLPVKFSDKKEFNFTTSDKPLGQHTFRLLIPQGGVSIVDVYL